MPFVGGIVDDTVSLPARPPSVTLLSEISVGEKVAFCCGAAVGGVLKTETTGASTVGELVNTEIKGIEVGTKVGGLVTTELKEGILVCGVWGEGGFVVGGGGGEGVVGFVGGRGFGL